MGRLAGSVIITVSFGAALLAALTSPVRARGGHGFGGNHGGLHGAHFAAGGRHGNDPYIKAASDERDKLLNTKLKSICRGC